MGIDTVIRKYRYYQLMMVRAKTDGDDVAYELYRQITREYEKDLRGIGK
nr:hypothetical protein [Brevibacillus laterosporus]